MAAGREARFGSDLRLHTPAGGEHDLGDDGHGDLARATGIDNVVQALVLRLLVPEGELGPLGWPDFGSRLHELVGEPDVVRTRLRLAAYAREAVARDPRVREVAEVSVTTYRYEARLRLQVLLVDEEMPVDLSASLPLEAP